MLYLYIVTYCIIILILTEYQLKIFLSGPITNKKNFNKKEFNEKELKYQKLFPLADIYNPIKIADKYGYDKPYGFYLEISLRNLINSDLVVMLKDWQNSNGATCEHIVASALKKHIIDEYQQEEMEKNDN